MSMLPSFSESLRIARFFRVVGEPLRFESALRDLDLDLETEREYDRDREREREPKNNH